MSKVYDQWMQQHVAKSGIPASSGQRAIFDWVTAGLENIEVVVGDSAVVDLPADRVAFAFIDGNHDSSYVRNDFRKVWDRLSAGEVIALHDYDHDLPEVTRTIHELVGEYAAELERVWSESIIFFAQRR